MIEITEFPKSGIITEHGVYDIPMSIYHTQCCDGPSISSGGMRTTYHESPADFWAFSDLNKDRYEKEDSDAFIFGRAAHALLLGDAEFDKHFALIPEDAPKRPTVTQLSAAEEGRVSDDAFKRISFWHPFDKEHAGKDWITFEDMKAISGISRKLEADPVIHQLFDGEAEKSVFWKDKKTGLWLKSRIDMLPVNDDIADLKTTTRKNERHLHLDIKQHGYDMQLALAAMANREVLGKDIRNAILIFVNKRPPYHVMPVEISADALYCGMVKVRHAIDTIAECLESGHWPGPVEGISTYRNETDCAEVLEMQRKGELPNV